MNIKNFISTNHPEYWRENTFFVLDKAKKIDSFIKRIVEKPYYISFSIVKPLGVPYLTGFGIGIRKIILIVK